MVVPLGPGISPRGVHHGGGRGAGGRGVHQESQILHGYLISTLLLNIKPVEYIFLCGVFFSFYYTNATYKVIKPG